jgi:predicted nucleotidyltransferase
MRISTLEIDNLLGSIKQIDQNASVYLFGSRTDNQKKGGDIDIAILSKLVSLKEKIEIKYNFYQAFGEQKLDLLIVSDENMPFWQVIKDGAILLTNY